MRVDARLLSLLALALLLNSCGIRESGPERPWRPSVPLEPGLLSEPDPAWDVLIAGGNAVLGRWMHTVVARHGPAWPLGAIAPWLEAGDATLVNLLSCVASSGHPVEKGFGDPDYIRARPEMLALLTGVDAVTLANRHVGDYGPLSVAETLRWTREAGLVTVGAGLDLEQAQRPELLQVGRTRLALAALDVTLPAFHPGPGRPGVNHVPAGDLALFEERVRRLGEWARGRCDLLALSIHWGRIGDPEVSALQRQMAAMAFQAGVDLILGHGSQRLKGVELIEGKLVLYDMGNLLLDTDSGQDTRSSGLFRLRLSPQGVHRLEVLPISVGEGRTLIPTREERASILEKLATLCERLGTRLDRRLAGNALIGVVEVDQPRVSRRPLLREAVPLSRFPARRDFEPPRAEGALRAALPGDATRPERPVECAPDVELLGWRVPARVQVGTQLRLTTWLRVRAPVAEPWLLSFDLRAEGRQMVGPLAWRHEPADWAVPFRHLEPGAIVEDHYRASLRGVRPGLYELRFLILDCAQETRVIGTPLSLGKVLVED